MIHSLTALAQGAATTRFLDTVDQHLNSNTLLIVLAADQALDRQSQVEEFLTRWLRSTLFNDMLLEAEQLRRWHNLTPARIHRFSGQVHLQPLSPLAWVERLWWMVQEGPSPYQQYPPRSQAIQLIYEFGNELLGDHAWEGCPISQLPILSNTIEQEWRFYAMPPTLLTATITGYFYNLQADSITIITHGDLLYFMTTNGSD